MKSALLVLLVALPCWAQDSKLDELNSKIAANEKQLSELKEERAKLIGSMAMPQERAMWADPKYAKATIEKEKLKPQLEDLKKCDQQLCKERNLVQAASGLGAADFDRTTENREISAKLAQVRAEASAIEAKISACDLELFKLREKYKVSEKPKGK